MNYLFSRFISENKLIFYFSVFYVVGLLLFAFPFTRPLFVLVTPWSLLMVIAIVFIQHKAWDLKTALYFLGIIIASFVLESRGVATGEIFGQYSYQDGMGIQFLDTPLLIGLNWLFLVYATRGIASSFTSNSIYKVLLGTVLMISYDFVLEVVAPIMSMWRFSTAYPPIENFVSWFIAALVFHSGFAWLGIEVRNPSAICLFCIQVLFFVLISCIYYLQ